MNKTRFRLLIFLVIFCGLLIGYAASASAAPSLQWQTEQVYYEGPEQLTIEGQFYNNGTRTITWINWLNLYVYLRQYSTPWQLQASANFNNLNVTLLPGESVHWTFRITNVDFTYFDYWNVKWNVNYNCQ